MSAEQQGDEKPRIIVDSDWKQEAQAEKEKLDRETSETKGGEVLAEASLLELINMIVMQAAVGLGGYTAPSGAAVPPDLATAKHFIDLLEVLQKKTEGNVTDQEKTTLDAVLYEMRMRYVEASPPPPKAPAAGS